MKLLTGVINALMGREWQDDIDVSAHALPRSFLAIALYVPLGLVVASAVVHYNDNTATPPYQTVAITLGLIGLAFPLIAYILCMLFNKTAGFRPWVIVRNWAIFFALAAVAAIAGLYLAGLVPFALVYFMGFGLYLGTLAIDIRLAWRIAGFDWIGAVFAGILISAATMMILSQGVNQSIG
ncbi:MAG: hypothetical protein COA91_09070 [Robiginitomaculum sp.]|nr:MAG: hypothetical protein COA91_09070 [Robiginitomaculum sp.]